MRKLKLFEHISLDGVISPGAPGEYGDAYANGGWTAPYRSPAGAAAIAKLQGTGFDLLLGRRTYDLWAAYWPTVKGGPFADALNAAIKYVATHRPESLGWGPVGDLGADVVAGIRRVKSTDGPDLIVWGSSTLTSVLLEKGLVDRGKRLFADSVDPRELALVSTQAFPSGLILSVYNVTGALKTG
jgi:dihydrofolate reductase